jgi:5-methylcytosine-specific restriction endonuclease McrA
MARGSRVASAMNCYDRRRVGAKPLADQGGRCALCCDAVAFAWQGVEREPGGPSPAHIDYIRPHCEGGTNRMGNLRVLCSTCNLERRFTSEG